MGHQVKDMLYDALMELHGSYRKQFIKAHQLVQEQMTKTAEAEVLLKLLNNITDMKKIECKQLNPYAKEVLKKIFGKIFDDLYRRSL